MIIYACGDIFGQFTDLYKRVSDIEKETKLSPSWLLQSGNIGIFPDPDRVDRQTRLKSNPEFADLYFRRQMVPKPTLFVSGKHEDNPWLDFKLSKGEMLLLGNLHWLVNGYRTLIGDNESQFSVTGLGKCFSPQSYFNGKRNKKTRAHYTLNEVERACSQGPTDILLTHQAGHGEKIGNFLSDSQGINKICYAIRPKVHIHGGYNVSSVYKNKQGILTVSLAFGEIKIIEINKGMVTIHEI